MNFTPADLAAGRVPVQALGPVINPFTGTDLNPAITPPSPAASGASLNVPSPNDGIITGIVGALGGYVTGGVPGAIAGGLAGYYGPDIAGSGGQVTVPSTMGQPFTGTTGTQSSPIAATCPSGYVKVGSTCVALSPGAYLPGGQPATTPVTGTTVAAGGTTAAGAGLTIGGAPMVKTEYRRVCPRGWVLAIDGNCYPKQMIPRSWRLHKPRPRPPITAADAKAIRRAASAKKRVERLGKKVGLHVYTTARSSKSSSSRRK